MTRSTAICDQRGTASREGRRLQAAGAGAADHCRLPQPPRGARGDRRRGFINFFLTPKAYGRELAALHDRGENTAALKVRVVLDAERAYYSSSSLPTRRGHCTSGMDVKPLTAPHWATSWLLADSKSLANTTSTTPDGRSTFLRRRARGLVPASLRRDAALSGERISRRLRPRIGAEASHRGGGEAATSRGSGAGRLAGGRAGRRQGDLHRSAHRTRTRPHRRGGVRPRARGLADGDAC